jgi:hypothetical protein
MLFIALAAEGNAHLMSRISVPRYSFGRRNLSRVKP